MRIVLSNGGTGLLATRAATVVSELARNAVQHARGGAVRIRVAARAVEVVVEDHGPGIADVDAVMRDTYTSRTGLGKGLKGVKRISAEFDIKSVVGTGTTVTARRSL